jgi:glyoxylase-like metal-dependent hydrolase (beta-lactamase superfamily II)/rhodanese-related sulfurtransferase
VTPEELNRAVSNGDPVRLLDVRTRAEHDEWRVAGESVETAVVPYSRFMAAEVRGSVDELADGLELDGDGPVVVVCGRGETSDRVAELLRGVGVDAENLAGGMRGWARVYGAREVPVSDVPNSAATGGEGEPGDGGPTVLQYRRPSSGCLAYLVVSGGEAAVIDPLRAFAERYAADARERGAELRYAVDTHVHADHVSGVREVANLAGAAILLPAGARDRGLDYGDGFDVEFVGDGDEVRVGGATLTAVHAPGHTSEMTAYRVADLLFAGDSLFVESVARPDLEEGDEGAPAAARRLHRTLTGTYAAFDDDVRVAPAHYGPAADAAPDGTYTARLGTLRERLPALSATEDAFVAHVLESIPPRPSNYEAIIEANLGRRRVDDDEAFELELGPNNCAATA